MFIPQSSISPPGCLPDWFFGSLSETDYDVFAGLAPTKAFLLALNSIAESYTDRYGFYIYDAGELSPLNDWLRSADLSAPFYVGGTINYHF